MTDDSAEPTDVDTDVEAWGTTRFRPGSDVGLVARHTVGLIARDNASTRERLWGLVADDSPIDDILDELSSTGLKALPAFGLVRSEGDAVRVVARGRVTVVAELSSGDVREIDAADVRTWIEELVNDVVAVTITLPPGDDDRGLETADGDVFAVLAGSVPASEVVRRFDGPDRHAAQAASGPGWSTARSVPAAHDEPDVDPADAAPPEAGDSWLDDEGGTVDPLPSATIPPRPTVDDEAATGVDPDESAAATTARGHGGVPSSPQPPPPSTSALFDDASDEAGPESSSIPDRDGATVSGAGPDAVPTAAGDTDSSRPTDTDVQYVLAFSNGERVDVDRTVLIGRNPKVSPSAGGGLHRVMKFDGPGQGLSRTHAEVRVEDGALLLVDLESTNGTEVQLPGQGRRRLVGGEPVVIVPGSLIDFGDELHCTVESAP